MQPFGMDKYEFRRQRLIAIRDEKCSGNAADLARRIGKDGSYVTRLLWPAGKKGGKRIGDDLLDAIELAFPGWLTGLSDHDVSKFTNVSRGDVIDIPASNAIASMGTGHPAPENESLADHVRVTRSWVRANFPNVSNADNLAALSAYGDSMCPTFSDGDTLIVDRGIIDIKIDAVYVLSLRGELYIKRMQRRPNGVMMISDNTQYPPYLITNGELDEFKVLGRVVWAWNGRKL